MPYLKFLASTIPKIWRESLNFKSRSRDSFLTPFDLILHFVCYMEESENFKSRSRDPFLTPFDLILHFIR